MATKKAMVKAKVKVEGKKGAAAVAGTEVVVRDDPGAGGTLAAIEADPKFVELVGTMARVQGMVNQFLSLPLDEAPADVVQAGVGTLRLVKQAVNQSEDLRKSITKPLWDAKASVDKLFKKAGAGIPDLEDQARVKVAQAIVAAHIAETVKYPGIGLLIIKPKTAYVVVNMDEVPADMKETVLKAGVVQAAIDGGVRSIPGLIIEEDVPAFEIREG